MDRKKILSVVVILFSITGLSIATVIHDVSDTEIDYFFPAEDCEQACCVFDDKDPGVRSGFSAYQTLDPLPAKTEEQLATMIQDPQPTRSFSDIPSQFSWMDYDGGNWMTPARNQGSCGSCWAFAALGSMEGVINIASYNPDTNIDLSEQYVLSCLGASGSCNGGWMSSALQCIQSTSSGNTGNGINGVPIESCMPYQASHSIPCGNKCDDWDYVDLSEDGVLWQIEDYGVSSGDSYSSSYWNLLKTWLMDYGPLAVDIYASSAYSGFWSNNNNPNAVYEGGESSTTNHGQTLVGWKDDPTVKNGGYWILKNSWGANWGYNGFCNVAYGCLRIGDREVTWVSVPDWEKPPDAPVVPPQFRVSADFSYDLLYPRLGNPIQFNDESTGPVVLYEWDFTGDGEIDSTAKRPSWVYTKEGDHEVRLTVWSTYGYSNSLTRVVRVREVWPPVAVISPEQVTQQGLQVHFDGRYSYDPDGQVASYHWNFDDGTTSSEKTVTHVFPEIDRYYEVTLTVTDNEGAAGSVVCPVYIDVNVPPVTVAATGFDEEDDVWFSSSINVALIAEDWTGVKRTYYRLNDGEWNEKMYVQGNTRETWYVQVHDEGVNTLEFYSVDTLGNVETKRSKSIRIDKTAPSVDISVFGGDMNDEWYTSPVEVRLSASDVLSGVDSIIYRIEAGPWIEYDKPFTIGDGIYRVWAYAIDKAGNTGGSDTPVFIQVDTGAPVTTARFIGEGGNGLFYNEVSVMLSSADAGSGVDRIMYRVNGGTYQEYDGVFVLDQVGLYVIEFYAVDTIGNQESASSVSVTVSDVKFVAELKSPTSGLYLFGVNLFRFTPAIVIGPVDIEVTITALPNLVADVSLVEFLVDGVVVGASSVAPYTYRLTERYSGSHEVGVRVIGGSGGSVELSNVATFFIF